MPQQAESIFPGKYITWLHDSLGTTMSLLMPVKRSDFLVMKEKIVPKDTTECSYIFGEELLDF